MLNTTELNAVATAHLLDNNFNPETVDAIHDWAEEAKESDNEIMHAIFGLILAGEITISWDSNAHDVLISKLNRVIN